LFREKSKSNRIAYWSFDEGQGSIANDLVSDKADEIDYALRKGRYQQPINPIWSAGIKGTSLMYDGYSTYIRRDCEEIGRPIDELTITVWVAPGTYDLCAEERLSAIVNQHDREAGQGYILGLYRNGAWSLQLGLSGQWVEIWSHEDSIPLRQWSFIAATYSKSDRKLKLFLNGKQVAERTIESELAFTPYQGELLVGRNNQGVVLAESFIMNGYEGLMDELVIYGRALSAEEIKNIYQDDLRPHGGEAPAISEDIWNTRALRKNDRHRPQYHLTAPSHWMNEPHAPIYFEGKYHLFYQYNPRGPFWHHIHWGHWVSEDLVHWRDLPPAISPSTAIDGDGIWSGSASVDSSGTPVLFYTAGDFEAFPTQKIALATSTYPSDNDSDLTNWVKHPSPIVEQDKDVGLYGEFRDPFVWEEDGVWYMLVGSGTAGAGGTAYVYTSVGDLTQWEPRGPLYISNYSKYPYLGTAWELPVLLPLPVKRNEGYSDSGKHIFIICPWGDGAKVEVNYWIGHWDRAACRFIPDSEEPGLIDVGDFHFTGPSGMIDPRTGRSLLFTIAQGERTPEIDYDCGWSHGGGLPVSLYIREDGQLGIEPIEEMQLLRGRKLLSANDHLAGMNNRLKSIQGDMLEIRVRFEEASAQSYGLSLRRTPDGEEETIILYNRQEGRLEVNREKSTQDASERIGGIQGGSLNLNGEDLDLVIYIDRSLIECYANGVKSLTTRTYPSRTDALGVCLWSTGEVERMSMEIWEMNPSFIEN